MPIWNAQCGRNHYLSWILRPYLTRNKYKDILGFGAGDLCILLAEDGFNISYMDINKKLVDFSKWRFTRRKLDIKIIDGEKLETREFDCVLSFDVFEHLKNLPQKLKNISNFIRKKAVLFLILS